MRRKRDTEPPWVAAAMSRASWYRHGKPAERPAGGTDRDMAEFGGISLRSWQRFMRITRDAPELIGLITAGKLSLGRAEETIRRAKRRGQLGLLKGHRD